MKIETEKGIITENATKEDLEKLFINDGFKEFVILFNHDNYFVQTSKIKNDSFVVEYCCRNDDGNDVQFQSVNKLNRTEVLAVFVKYLKGDDSWKNMYQWEKENLKPWWKFW
ncbi:MAG TPA: hypothetical protein VIS94_08920 [Desulfomonilia bacterium]